MVEKERTVCAAYAPGAGEVWLDEWLAGVDEVGHREELPSGAVLVPGTNMASVQLDWLRNHRLPDLEEADFDDPDFWD